MAEKEIKRMSFFDGQFLKEGEFIDEQYYHLHMRRRMNYILFENAGVINVSSDDLKFINIDNSNKTFRVKAGMAISRNDNDNNMEAKEIILRQDSPTQNLNDEGISSGQTAYVTIHYEEEPTTDPPSEGDINKETRVKEKAVIKVDSSKPTGPAPNGEEYILLGALDYDTMTEDYSDRQEAKIRASLVGAQPVTLVSIAIIPASPTIRVGHTIQLTATGIYSDNSTSDITTTVTWSSDNQAVATVNSQGMVTAVTVGTVTITAEAQGKKGTATITASAAPVPAPEFKTGIPGTPGTEFDPNGGHNGTSNATDINLYGLNFSVDHPNLPTVQLIESGGSVLHTFVVSNVTSETSAGIAFEVIHGKVGPVTQITPTPGKIRVTTSGGSIISNDTFTIFPS